MISIDDLNVCQPKVVVKVRDTRWLYAENDGRQEKFSLNEYHNSNAISWVSILKFVLFLA
jgi:hypothetical protein